MRCPRCGSLETKRKGMASTAPRGVGGPLKPLRRFLCRGCGRSFTLGRDAALARSRYTREVKAETVRLYVEGLASYRVLSRLMAARVGELISPVTLNRWVLETAQAAKTPLQVSAELAPPAWGGFLGVDGKTIWVRGTKHALLVGVDHPSQDVVHALVVEAENGEGVARLVTEAAADGGYPLRGVVSDLGTGFRQAIADYFGVLPFPGLPGPRRPPPRPIHPPSPQPTGGGPAR